MAVGAVRGQQMSIAGWMSGARGEEEKGCEPEASRKSMQKPELIMSQLHEQQEQQQENIGFEIVIENLNEHGKSEEIDKEKEGS